MEFKEEAQLEQFRSVIAIGASALKSAILINGGGVIALLAFLGNQKDQQGLAWFVSSMFLMCGGIALAAFGNVFAYIAQIKHLNQLKSERPGEPAGTPWGYAAVTLIVISVFAFIGGVILASFGFLEKIKKIAQASPLRGWTVFKSQFCGFAAQKYSTKPQLKNCRLARR